MSGNDFFKIKDLVLDTGWSLRVYDGNLNYIKERLKPEDDLYQILKYVDLNNYTKSFRYEIEVGTIQFLIGISPQQKKVCFYTKSLHYELSILELNEYSCGSIDKDLTAHVNFILETKIEDTPAEINIISSAFGLPLFDDEISKLVEKRGVALSKELVVKVKQYRQSLFERVSDFGLDLTANYMLIRIHLLKFLAILPCLSHDKEGHEVKRIFVETLSRLQEDSRRADLKGLTGQARGLPELYIFFIKQILMISRVLPAGVLAKLIRFLVSKMAQRFIAGENILKAQKSLTQLMASNRDATIDQLGELVVSSLEADDYTNKVLEIIGGMKNHISPGDKNRAGILKAHVSIKVSALANDFSPQDFMYSYKQVQGRLKSILLFAKAESVFINIDAEDYHYRDTVLSIYSKLLLETEELSDFADTGIVIQAYLRDGHKHFKDVLSLAKKRSLLMPIRVVKGAYWDAETIEARVHSHKAPQFLNKEETDIHFRQLISLTLKHGSSLQLAVASHNIQDHCFSEAMRSIQFPDAPVIEHQCLHMTYEALSIGLAKMNWATRNYIPIGDLLVGMAYLVRRIMENSSQVGVLTIMRSHKKNLPIRTPSKLLKYRLKNKNYEYEESLTKFSGDFFNIFSVRTYIKRHLEEFIQAKSNYEDRLSNAIFVGDRQIICSSRPELVIGAITEDTKDSVNKKIAKLKEGYDQKVWRQAYSSARFESLYRLAGQMLIKRNDLAVMIMFEAGKTIDEAFGDVDEAIDFIHFYLKEQLKIEKTENYQAKGVIGVIAPWNFPLAIPCGMSVAALVAGNSVILKPAEQTPLIARAFIDICRDVGIGDDILALAVGAEEVGKTIVDHRLVNGVVFTGSKTVGHLVYNQITKKKTSKEDYDFGERAKFAITEMGGKNAIIVTNNCELDETVAGILYAAFAHSGQKCSAASRIIIDAKIKDAFIKRFVLAVSDIMVGSATSFATLINPLITLEDQKRVRKLAKRASDECREFNGTIHLDYSQNEYVGFCVGPSLFELDRLTVLNNKTVATEEVFGPLVHIVPYDTLDEAVEIFNATEFALTGGIFCQSQNDLDYLLPKLEAGNIYINRPNTGARVAIEPFGGFKFSGTGPKAGSPSYLYKFNQLKAERNTDFFEAKIENEITCEESLFNMGSLAIKRKEKMSKLLVFLNNNLEAYFGRNTDFSREDFTEFEESFEQGLLDLDINEYPNHYIPGQIGYIKKDIALGRGILVDCTSDLSSKTLICVCMNLLIGNSLKIICTSSEAYSKWDLIMELVLKAGYSNYNIQCDLKSMNSALVDTKGHDFLVSTADYLPEFFLDSFLSDDKRVGLGKVIYLNEFKYIADYINNFSHDRSFAINTMRHGAPLDLTI